MIQDMSDLAELGTLHKEKLEAVGMDLKLLDEARSESGSLLNLLGAVTVSAREYEPVLELRNKSFYHLKEAVDEIRKAGQFAFRNNKERCEGYYSDHIRKMNRKPRKINPDLEE